MMPKIAATIRKLPSAAFDNFGLKMLALILSIAVWFYANSRGKAEVALNVPLTIKVPRGFKVLHQSSDTVMLVVSGPMSLISRLESESQRVSLSMQYELSEADLAAGRFSLDVQKKWLKLPESELIQLNVRRASPQTVTIYTSEVGEVQLPVEVRFDGEAKEGYEVGVRRVVPRAVTVRGPVRVLDRMESMPTEEIPIAHLESGTSEEIPLAETQDFVLENGKNVAVLLDVAPSVVTVALEVHAQEQTRRFVGVRPQFLLPQDFPYTAVVDETVTLIATGLPQNLERLGPGSIRAYVDLSGLATDKIALGASALYKEDVRLRLPEDIPLSSVVAEPDEVTVRLENPAQ